jgi:hypothetical protein
MHPDDRLGIVSLALFLAIVAFIVWVLLVG